MRAGGLSLVLVLGAAGAALAAQDSAPSILAAPDIRYAKHHPDLPIFDRWNKPKSHANALAPIEARATGVTCDDAYFMALAMLTGKAEEAGGDGVIDLHSPGAEDAPNAAYACRDMDGRSVVQLSATAAKLQGSDVPYVAPTRLAGQPAEPLASSYPPGEVRSLTPLYPDGPVLLSVPAWITADRSTVFVDSHRNVSFKRRINDIDAEGVSNYSCEEAIGRALFALQKRSDAFDAVGVVGVRSADLGVRDGWKYTCHVQGSQMTVNLTGVAAGLPLDATP